MTDPLKKIGVDMDIPANTIFDNVFMNIQNSLTNYTRIYFPTFKYNSALLGVTVKESYIEGLQSFHRVGDVSLGVYPLGRNTFKFGLGFDDITAVFNVDVYIFQFWMNLIPEKGTLTLKFSNISSTQAFSYGTLSFLTFLMDDLDLRVEKAAVEVEGFNPSVRASGDIISAFIDENKDSFLEILSFILKTLFNACVSALKSIVVP